MVRKLKEKPFKTFDGEAVNNEYCLLASNTRHIWQNNGPLSTEYMLRFLHNEGQGFINVFYSFHYDVINILRDLDAATIKILNKANECVWGDWHISYFPRKILSLTRQGRRVTFFDISGFWQSSYEKAIEKTLDITDDTISKGKAMRATFTRADKDFIIAYNQRELDTMLDLVNKLAEVCVDFKITSWHGASALSTSVLKRIPSVAINHKLITDLDADTTRFIDSGYYGGRIETNYVGYVPDCVSFDIVSAYPTAMRTIKDIGRLEYVTDYHPETDGIYEITFSLGRADYPCPFPVRSNGRIFFPAAGKTIVTSHEVAAWHSAFSSHFPNGFLRIHRGIISHGNDRPLCSEVDRLFAIRKQLKADKDAREMAYKLALNASYGKLAQRIGTPKFAVPFWAAMITGHCRATMMRLAAVDPSAVVSFATDSIVYKRTKKVTAYNFDVGKSLGQLESEHECGIRIIQSGLYKWDDKAEAKVRGFRGLDFDAAYENMATYREHEHNARLLVGFNPPKKFLHLRGAIIDYPKLMRLESNVKRDYGFARKRDIRKTHYDSKAWPSVLDVRNYRDKMHGTEAEQGDFVEL